MLKALVPHYSMNVGKPEADLQLQTGNFWKMPEAADNLSILEISEVMDTYTEKTQERLIQAREQILLKIPDSEFEQLKDSFLFEIPVLSDIQSVSSKVKELTPELIAFLKAEHDKVHELPGVVFEHLVAEFLAEQGFENVRHVGRNIETSADIYASEISDTEISRKIYYIEVTRANRGLWGQVVPPPV